MATKKPKSPSTSDATAREVERLYNWCRVVVETLAEFDPLQRATKQDSLEGLDRVRRGRELSGLREGANDLLLLVQGLPANERARIDSALRGRLGAGLDEELDVTADEVRKIVARGAVENEDELRLLQSWLEIIGMNPDERADAATVERLIESYLMHG